jgi:hypothetical protein
MEMQASLVFTFARLCSWGVSAKPNKGRKGEKFKETLSEIREQLGVS